MTITARRASTVFVDLAEFAGNDSRSIVVEPSFQTLAISKRLNCVGLAALKHTTALEALNHVSGFPF